MTILSEPLDLHVRMWLNRRYGTESRALYTVFEMTVSGCWLKWVSPMVMDEPVVCCLPFSIVYITCAVFAMVRIISALFLEETLAQAARDIEMMARENVQEESDAQVMSLYLATIVYKAFHNSGDEARALDLALVVEDSESILQLSRSLHQIPLLLKRRATAPNNTVL